MTSTCFYLYLNSSVVAFSLYYPGVGPEHSFLKDIGRAEYHSVTDNEALEGMDRGSQIILL